MPRRITGLLPASILLTAGLPAAAAIFPDQLGEFTKGAPPKVQVVPEQPLYAEFGFEDLEQATYAAPAKSFSGVAWRFRDSTGAMAMFQAARPPAASYKKLAELTASTPDGVLFAHGNYVFRIKGSFPSPEVLSELYEKVPKMEQSPLPPLIGYLPTTGLVPNSERYILGPVSLDQFGAGISPSAAAFHLGAEGQLARYQTPEGTLTLLVLNYPTPNLARERADSIRQIPGLVVKRTGSLVALVPANPDPDQAERLLSQVNYEANLTWNETPPQVTLKRAANLFLTMFALAGLVILLSIVAGVGFGGFRVLRRKLIRKAEPEGMISLHLE
jgi:hypothetical protein